jgi:hypothetical protein
MNLSTMNSSSVFNGNNISTYHKFYYHYSYSYKVRVLLMVLFYNSWYLFYVSRGAHNPKYKDAMQVHCRFPVLT